MSVYHRTAFNSTLVSLIKPNGYVVSVSVLQETWKFFITDNGGRSAMMNGTQQRQTLSASNWAIVPEWEDLQSVLILDQLEVSKKSDIKRTCTNNALYIAELNGFILNLFCNNVHLSVLKQ